MNGNEADTPIGALGPDSHTWKQAAQYVAASLFEEPLRRWLRDSGLPGTDNIAEDGAWALSDRIRFLKVLCGEQK